MNSAGLARNSPRKLIFSFKKYNGLDIKHPYYLQAILHIQTIMNLESLDKQTKNLITTSWEECRWECGTLGHLTECPLQIIKGVTSTWVRNTIIFMINHSIDMEDRLTDIKTSRIGDASIRKRFIQVTKNV